MAVPLERVLGAEVGAIYRDIHTAHGVQMLLGAGVEAFEGAKQVERVLTSDGRRLDYVGNAYHPFYGERIRVEHWANALNQGPAAARNMLGQADVYQRLPYFYSDQYEVGMEYSGLARSWDRVVLRGDPAGGEFIAFWMSGDRVLAGMNVNVWDVTAPIQRLIRERVPVDDRQLADSDIPLDQIAPTKQGSTP